MPSKYCRSAEGLAELDPPICSQASVWRSELREANGTVPTPNHR